MGKTVEDLPRVKPKSTNKSLKLSLPVPPSVNAIYYNTRGGGRRLTSKAEHYIRDSRALTNVAIEEQGWTLSEKGIWLYVDMVFYFPDRRRRDSHNTLKILLDALEGLIYKDDMYVLPRIQSVEYDKDNPRVEINISAQTKTNRDKGLKVTAQEKTP